jgi:hypothetical protein
MQLHEWQRGMQTAVVSGQDHPRLSLRTTGIDRRTGLGIYQYAYRARLLEALQCNFPALHQLLGDDHFALAGHGFRHRQPPTRASIRWFGEGFSRYLAETAPFSDCPAMAELARFEWALRHTIDAADAQRIETQQLQAVAPEAWHALLFDLHPSLQLLFFDWNVPFIWQALMDEQTPPAPKACPRPGWYTDNSTRFQPGAAWKCLRRMPWHTLLRATHSVPCVNDCGVNPMMPMGRWARRRCGCGAGSNRGCSQPVQQLTRNS